MADGPAGARHALDQAPGDEPAGQRAHRLVGLLALVRDFAEAPAGEPSAA